ncbi:hypothetical protein GBA52_009259 [Prunus armeniaca]|nr:hypothetical protein GBA52_009259 [Prunus armeniaca]
MCTFSFCAFRHVIATDRPSPPPPPRVKGTMDGSRPLTRSWTHDYNSKKFLSTSFVRVFG